MKVTPESASIPESASVPESLDVPESCPDPASEEAPPSLGDVPESLATPESSSPTSPPHALAVDAASAAPNANVAARPSRRTGTAAREATRERSDMGRVSPQKGQRLSAARTWRWQPGQGSKLFIEPSRKKRKLLYSTLFYSSGAPP